MKVKRIEAGNYLCELDGVKFGVFHIQGHEYKNNALARQNSFGSYSRVTRVKISHWAFNTGTGLFGGYGSMKQALDAAVRTFKNK